LNLNTKEIDSIDGLQFYEKHIEWMK